MTWPLVPDLGLTTEPMGPVSVRSLGPWTGPQVPES
jgi:hypothetical protein